MTTSPRKKRTSARSPVSAATLGAEGLEQVVPIGDALIVVLAVVEDYASRYPKRAAVARADWARVVDRALFAASDAKSFPNSMSEVDRIVLARLDEKGWPEPLGADEKQVTELAWERIKLRCSLSDTQGLQRLKKGRKR
jgi:hypothetical protein